VTARVLVVEDSLTVRRRLVDLFESDPELEVVGEAEDGRTAIELCGRLRPDVVTLDMMLPVMSGLAAAEYIMAHFPTPIVIVSASVNRGELFRTYEALAAGALEVVEKPLGEAIDDGWERKLLDTVKLVSRIRVITHLRARRAARGAPLEAPASAAARAASEPGRACRLVALGASTGGTSAVLSILQSLPPSFPLPILLVLHLARAFATAFAEWLGEHSPLPAGFARDGEPLPAPGEGRVVVAPADRHLVVSGGRLRLSDAPERHSCRPSVDVLFESVAAEVGAASAACLLTGMGRDGAAGLLAIRRAGGLTFAQDEGTSVVFGMPREAILLGAAVEVLPLESFAPALAALAGAPRKET